jgi:predicted acylesterase/phospholipase RssA
VSGDPGCALVLSGGGAKGAYEIGVLKALAAGLASSTDGQPLRPHIFTGTSVGAYNAVQLASDDDFSRAVKNLEKIWVDQIGGSFRTCGNGVFRLRTGPLQFLQPGCAVRPVETLADVARDTAFWAGFTLRRAAGSLLSEQSLGERLANFADLSALFSSKPLQELIHSTVNLEKLRRSSTELRFVGTDWLHGQALIFDRQALEDEEGLQALLGSASIPGIFPPVPYRETELVDGGLVMNTPLKPALAAGATVLHVIYLDPFLAEIPLSRQSNSLETFYRTYTVLLGTSVRQEFVTAERINQVVKVLRSLRAQRTGLGRQLQRDLGPLLKKALQREDEGRPYREITVHRYRPETDLGGGAGVLDFRSDFLQQLIETGFEDALAHDCTREGCILPGTEQSEEELEDGVERLVVAPP